MPLQIYKNIDDIEVGLDEAGRGCLAGPVVAAGVILPKIFPDTIWEQIKDSKKLSEKKRNILSEYIKKHAISYHISFIGINIIDNINILHASIKAMHECIQNLSIIPDNLLVDGNYFTPYKHIDTYIPHQCIKKGDDIYLSIASASILAKTARDNYIIKLCEENPEYDKYGWRKNKCYGTKQHRDAIKKYGKTHLHRKSFRC